MNEKDQFELFTNLFDLTVILDVGVLCAIVCALYACLRCFLNKQQDNSLFNELVLSNYWTPEGAPLWKWHLPVLLIKVIMLGYTVFLLYASKVDFGHLEMCIALTGLLVMHYMFARRARAVWGNTPPMHSLYSALYKI